MTQVLHNIFPGYDCVISPAPLNAVSQFSWRVTHANDRTSVCKHHKQIKERMHTHAHSLPQSTEAPVTRDVMCDSGERKHACVCTGSCWLRDVCIISTATHLGHKVNFPLCQRKRPPFSHLSSQGVSDFPKWDGQDVEGCVRCPGITVQLLVYSLQVKFIHPTGALTHFIYCFHDFREHDWKGTVQYFGKFSLFMRFRWYSVNREQTVAC